MEILKKYKTFDCSIHNSLNEAENHCCYKVENTISKMFEDLKINNYVLRKKITQYLIENKTVLASINRWIDEIQEIEQEKNN
jgi:hypothetical protein